MQFSRDFERPGRSPATAPTAMAATAHPSASAAALDILRQGGNAADAAIAAAAVLHVLEPHMSALGGDLFAIVAKPDGAGGVALDGVNASGRSPAGLTREIAAQAGGLEPTSPHAVTVPGAVAGWGVLNARHGSMGLDKTLTAAIDYAEKGAPVAPRVARDWADEVSKLAKTEGGRRHYLRDGAAPSASQFMAYPALAKALRVIAEDGPDAFYRGAIADDIVGTLQGLGGLMSQDDLAEHRADPVTPLSCAYRGIDILELPPNGQGLTAQIILNILERFDIAALDPDGPERAHLLIEAARAGYALRDREIADPASMVSAPEALNAKSLAADIAEQIDLEKRNRTLPDILQATKSDTTYLCILDGDGMAVSLITSLFAGFGSGIVTPEFGIALQNRGYGFTLEEGHPNMLAPRKRPFHTIIPGMALQNGAILSPFGVMGGQYQSVGHAHVWSLMRDHGFNPQAAIDAPRLFWDDSGAIELEGGFSDAVRDGLTARGHKITAAKAPIGGSQIIVRDPETGSLIGGSDPRKDGCAIGY